MTASGNAPSSSTNCTDRVACRSEAAASGSRHASVMAAAPRAGGRSLRRALNGPTSTDRTRTDRDHPLFAPRAAARTPRVRSRWMPRHASSMHPAAPPLRDTFVSTTELPAGPVGLPVSGQVPKPPPPGVRSRTTSPASRRTVHLSGRRSGPPTRRRRAAASSRRPRPARRRPGPTAAVTRRSVMSETRRVLEHLELPLDAVAAAARARATASPCGARSAARASGSARSNASTGVSQRVGHRGVHAAHAGRPTGRPPCPPPMVS